MCRSPVWPDSWRAIGGERARLGKRGLVRGEAVLHVLDVAGLPIAQRVVGAGVVRMGVGQIEVAGGLKLVLAGRGAEHEALLCELAIQHPDMKRALPAAGVGLLDGARRAAGEDRGRRQEHGGDNDQAAHSPAFPR
jgi:hypothetical protein